MMERTKALSLLIIIPLLLSGCELLESLNSAPTSPQAAAIYAVEIVEVNMHDCDTTNTYCDTSQLLGPADETTPWSGHFVSLGGNGGSFTARMSEPFSDGPGDDLLIYEVGAVQGGGDEPIDVYISTDMASWLKVGSEIKNGENSVYAAIDFGAAAAGNSFRYVKVEDRGTAGGGSSSGADIDAIEAKWRASP